MVILAKSGVYCSCMLASQPVLRLDKSLGKKLPAVRDNLSAVVLAGNHLWLGGDEGTELDRMTQGKDGNFAGHRRFDLRPLLKLPGDEDSEIDIEGLDVDNGFVWLVGSHALKRRKPQDGLTVKKNRKRLSRVETEANRFTLARVPIDSKAAPAKSVGSKRAARLEGDGNGNLLSRALAKDPHLRDFTRIPSKDNGIDIEGLAVRGMRAFVGLRGPVLRGWAVVLDLELKQAGRYLKFARPPRKHFLQLGGLGVREMVVKGKDLLILAGPTMDLDGPVFVFRWAKALDEKKEVMVPAASLPLVLTVPFGAGYDHAEGMTRFGEQIMICYDSPAPARLVGPDGVRADVFDL